MIPRDQYFINISRRQPTAVKKQVDSDNNLINEAKNPIVDFKNHHSKSDPKNAISSMSQTDSRSRVRVQWKLLKLMLMRLILLFLENILFFPLQ